MIMKKLLKYLPRHKFFSLLKMLHIKRAIVILPALFILLLISCNEAVQKNKLRPDENDIFLICNLYQQSLFSIKLADEALTRSTYIETKDIAKKIKSSCATIKTNLETIAGKKSFELPLDMSGAQLKTWKSLVANKGLEFDKAFLKILLTVIDLEKQTTHRIITSARDADFIKAGKSVLLVIETKEEIQEVIYKINRLKTQENDTADSLTNNP